MAADLSIRIEALAYLGDYMQSNAEDLRHVMQLAKAQNGWFTEQSMSLALTEMATSYLSTDVLSSISDEYALIAAKSADKRVGLILSGNLPLVGLHDIICVLLAGHTAVVKYSSKDTALLQHLMEELTDAYPSIGSRVETALRLTDIDAVIATGSNNTSGYFDAYFGKYPNIIRRNRSGVGVLSGEETDDDLVALGRDVFSYYGLGCRNVSHLLVPQGYTFDKLLGVWHDTYKETVMHHKYKNNFDFQYATMLLNKVDFLMNGCILLRESSQIASPIAVVHHQDYDTVKTVSDWCRTHADEVQCIVTQMDFPELSTFQFGHAQRPSFTDYADGVDTMSFLTSL